jgi:hypothetical protein
MPLRFSKFKMLSTLKPDAGAMADIVGLATRLAVTRQNPTVMFNRLKIFLGLTQLQYCLRASCSSKIINASPITNKQTMPTLLFLLSAACALESLRRIAAYLQ